MSAGAISLQQLIPTPPPPTALEAKLLRLVERIRADDALAFEELYRLTREDVARTLSHLMGRRSDLEDLIQETYLKLLKAVPNFRGESQFRTFLYRVCANVALMHMRSISRHQSESVEPLRWLRIASMAIPACVWVVGVVLLVRAARRKSRVQ